MVSVVLWLIGLIAIIFYGGKRVYALYKAEKPPNGEFLKQGTILIFYSTLVVGAAQFLNDATTTYNVNTPEVSQFWILVGLFASYLKYLAPFVFAAIGVNMVSHSLANKNT
ncbi:hypothetical protein [Agarivorans albus]|uniref:hypothetical protein n=1 Tax=Agarivorans albus TaxID=182262 RepID=UPI00058BADB7|nr:hypothetical protein [Agarivorans albus]